MGELIDSQPLFPGESEIDQLYCIQKILGPIISEHKEAFLKNQHFLGMRFPEISKFETLEKKYLGKTSKLALNFMRSLLCMNPEERLNSSQALNHPFFEGLKDDFSRPHTSSGNGKLGYFYQNKLSLNPHNKIQATNPINLNSIEKIDFNDQRAKTRSSVFATEMHENEILCEKKTIKEIIKPQYEDIKPKFPMFHITEEKDAKYRIKSLKKKIKKNDVNKYPIKNYKNALDTETPSGNGSKKQLPYINHYFNFEPSQKKAEIKHKSKEDGPDLCGGIKKSYLIDRISLQTQNFRS